MAVVLLIGRGAGRRCNAGEDDGGGGIQTGWHHGSPAYGESDEFRRKGPWGASDLSLNPHPHTESSDSDATAHAHRRAPGRWKPRATTRVASKFSGGPTPGR